MKVSRTVGRPRRLVLTVTGLTTLVAGLASGCGGDDGGGGSDGGTSTTSPTTSTTTTSTGATNGTTTTAPNTSNSTSSSGSTTGGGPTTTGATTNGAGGGAGAPGTTGEGGGGGEGGSPGPTGGPGGDCGAAGESCCQGRVCDEGVCVGNFQNQACETECGAPDQPCCEGGMGGGTCQSGLECNDDDTCEGEPCGAIGLACCTGAGQDCFGGADCVDDVCEMAEEQDDCGGNGDPCCEDDMCFGQLECNDDGICENN